MINSDNTCSHLQALMKEGDKLNLKRMNHAYSFLKNAYDSSDAESILVIKEDGLKNELLILLIMSYYRSSEEDEDKGQEWSVLFDQVSKHYNRIIKSCSFIYDYAFQNNISISEARKQKPKSGFESILNNLTC